MWGRFGHLMAADLREGNVGKVGGGESTSTAAVVAWYGYYYCVVAVVCGEIKTPE